MGIRRIVATFGAALLLTGAGTGASFADIIQDSIEGTDPVRLVAGSGTAGVATIRVVHTGGDGDPGCNIDAGERLTLDILTPAGITASPDPLHLYECGVAYPVAFTADATAVSGVADVAVVLDATGYNGTGGEYTEQVSIPITVVRPTPTDTTPPQVTPLVTGTIGNHGWYTSDVSVSWSVVDAESAVTTTGCDPVSVIEDQGAVTYTCSAASAGGTTSRSVTVKRDATPPTVTPGSVVGTGWRNSSLSQDFVSGDAMSGLVDPGDVAFTLTVSAESGSSSTPTSTSRVVYDVAGNSTTRTLSAFIDLTPPTVTPDDLRDTTWRNTPLSRTFWSADALAGLADPADAEFTLTAAAESGSASDPTVVQHTVLDNAGNATSRSVSALIDYTAPTAVAVTGIGDGATYWTGTLPGEGTVGCTAVDPLSGVAGCLVTGYSAEPGTHTLTATATDNAGNVATATLTYTVRKLVFAGFYAPVDMNGVLNTVKGGSTVPLKFELFEEHADGSRTELTDVAYVTGLTAVRAHCGTGVEDSVETLVATGQTELRYDAASGRFVQNWKTPTGAAGTCYRATVTLVDSSAWSALFKLR